MNPEILAILNKYVYNMSLSDALMIASEIESLTAPEAVATPVFNMAGSTLVTWIHGYDLSNGKGYVRDHKIATIKAAREAFRINGIVPGLKDCKEAVDRYLATIGYTAF